jgi:uncharacterized protein (DUF302 family)
MSSPPFARRLLLAAMLAAAAPAALAQPAAPQGLVTTPSAHPFRATIDRFAAEVTGAGWVVFVEIDHAAAARAAGLSLGGRTVVLFGNPRAGTPGMAAQPTLALDLPMRALVWEDAAGRVLITRSTGEDLAERVFARHGITVPPEARRTTEAFLDGLARRAAQ